MGEGKCSQNKLYEKSLLLIKREREQEQYIRPYELETPRVSIHSEMELYINIKM